MVQDWSFMNFSKNLFYNNEKWRTHKIFNKKLLRKQ